MLESKNKNKSSIIILVVLGLVSIMIALFFLITKGGKIEPISGSKEIMSTSVTQQIYSKNDKELAEKVLDDIFDGLKNAEGRYSLYKENSYTTAINNAAGEKYTILDDCAYELIEKSKKYSEISNGIFDITIAPITLAWGINSDSPRIVPQEEIDNLLNFVDYKKIIIDEENKKVMLEETGMKVDLGAIAKGEALMKSKEIYDGYDFDGVLLSIGGNILAIGNNGEDEYFNIAIKDPKNSDFGIVGILNITDTTISTSGSYERYFEEDGKTYHHIFDPRTGKPAETDLLSVSVIAKDGAYAEFLSTYLFIMGKDFLLEQMNINLDYSVIAVDDKNNVYISKDLEDIFEPAKDTDYNYNFY